MTERDAWELVYTRFDPDQPARESTWRVPRTDRNLAEVAEKLALPFAVPKILLMGTQGTGKSTWLLEVADRLTTPRLGIYLDLAAHFRLALGSETALQHVQPWEVVFLVGLATFRAGKDLGIFSDADGGSLGAAASRLRSPGVEKPTVDVAKLAGALAAGVGVAAGAIGAVTGTAAMVAAVAPGLTFLKATAESGRWNLPLGLTNVEHPPDQDPRVRDLVAAVNVLISTLRSHGLRVTALVDGLDRVREPATRDLLFLGSNLLAAVECAVVATGPLTLRREGWFTRLEVWAPAVLTEIPVLDPSDPWRPSGSVGFFEALWRVRTGDLPVRLAPEVLARLAWASGGRSREFVRFVREVAGRAWMTGGVTAPLVEQAIDDRRRAFEAGLHAGHIRVLEAVAADPQHRLPDDELVEDLLDRFWLLPYPNGSEWYFPHPLLTIRQVHPPGLRS